MTVLDTEPVVLEHVYNAPVQKVWTVLTDNTEIRKWYFQLENFSPTVGFKFQFPGGLDDVPQYLHLCEIIEIVKGRKLAYSWVYDGYPGYSEVSWELFEEGEKTRLLLTHTSLESFASAGADFSKASFKGGWNYFLNEALLGYLEPKA